jgi:hypothetical protein
MKRAHLDGAELEYELRDDGDLALRTLSRDDEWHASISPG